MGIINGKEYMVDFWGVSISYFLTLVELCGYFLYKYLLHYIYRLCAPFCKHQSWWEYLHDCNCQTHKQIKTFSFSGELV